MSIQLKNITMTLDPESIERAIQEVEELRDNLTNALSELARYVTEEKGPGIAKMYIAQFPAVDTGFLHDSITGEYHKGQHSGTIYAGAYYAAFVEYGTGIIGADNPHPEPQEWEYDTNGHGMAGWFYPVSDNPQSKAWHPDGRKAAGVKLAWTRGMPARPFMYNTLRELEAEVEREGGRIIAEYIP